MTRLDANKGFDRQWKSNDTGNPPTVPRNGESGQLVIESG